MHSRGPELLLSRMAALADPTRVRLLRLLERHELGVAELCEVLQLPQSTVSRHLKVLLDQGWVRNRSERTAHLYRMVLGELDAPARRLFMVARDQTEGWPTLQQDQLRLARRLEERSRGSREFFAGAAGQWDRLRWDYFGAGVTQAALLALLPEGWVVADLGCGTGLVTAALAAHVQRVIGVDQSVAMLKAARKRTAGMDNVDLRQGDLEALPLADAACDAAILLLVLGYVAEPALVLWEMARVVRPGGKVVVVDVLRHDREEFRRRMGQRSLGFDADGMRSLLVQARFEKVRCRPLPPDPEAKGPALLLGVAARPSVAPGAGE
jgi:SAM-dependent methyltransferase